MQWPADSTAAKWTAIADSQGGCLAGVLVQVESDQVVARPARPRAYHNRIPAIIV